MFPTLGEKIMGIQGDESQDLAVLTTEKAVEAPDLVGRELDAWLAEHVMGWTRYPEAMHPTDNRTIKGVLYCPPSYPYDWGKANCVPYYSSDIAAAMEMEDRIDALGMSNRYLNSLVFLVASDATTEDRIVSQFDWVHASAEQRARAAYQAMKGNHEPSK